MIVIVGLGNPGGKFKNTRHNAGFMAVDFFAQKNDFPEFAENKKSQSLVSEKDNVLLVKPQTFMNESGKAVKKIFKKSDILLVINDDIDLPLGKIKWSKDSGSGGHKGVDSIINALMKKDFIRLRIGICKETGKPEAVEKFVIENFKEEEKDLVKNVMEKSAESLDFFLKNGLEKTMNEYNK